MRQWWMIGLLMGSGMAEDAVLLGSGHVAKESRSIAGVSSIKLEGVGSLVIRQGSAESLSVEADDNLFPYIHTVLDEDGLLHIYTRPYHQLHSMTPIRYGVMVKDLQSIEAIGATLIEGNGTLRFSDLYVYMNGESRLNADIRTKNLVVEMSGVSDVTLLGKATAQNITLAGASQYHAKDLISDYVQISATGASEAQVQVHKQLKAILEASTNLSYQGNPDVKVIELEVGVVEHYSH